MNKNSSPIIKFEPCIYSVELMENLIKLNKNSVSKIDIEKIKLSIAYAKQYHGKQLRKSGEPYYSHPMEVAYIMSYYLLKTDVIIAAILHDTIEDTDLTIEIIKEIFGYRVAQMVDRLTRDRIDGEKLSVEEILENAHLAKDVEVLLIKIIDRFHNLTTLDSMSPEKIIKTIQETYKGKFLGFAAQFSLDIESLLIICLKKHSSFSNKLCDYNNIKLSISSLDL